MKTNLLKLHGHAYEAVIADRQVTGHVHVENGMVWLLNNRIGQPVWFKSKYGCIWLAGDGEREALERNKVMSLKVFSFAETLKLWLFESFLPLCIMICAVGFLSGLFLSIVTGFGVAKIVMVVCLVLLLIASGVEICNKNHIF